MLQRSASIEGHSAAPYAFPDATSAAVLLSPRWPGTPFVRVQLRGTASECAMVTESLRGKGLAGPIVLILIGLAFRCGNHASGQL